MLSQFFINRPIFACVISLVILLVGGISIPLLPIEKTPDITPPTVGISASYPGASAQVIADTVAAPIEEQVNGVDNMLYMSSKSSSDGSMDLTVTFEVGTDIDMSQVLVQNRVAIAEPLLPEEVRRQGVKTEKKSTNLTLMVNLISPDESYDEIFISNYINLYIKDTLARIPGVGSITVFGAKDFGMRIWLNPEKMKFRGLTSIDVLNAIKEQNIQVAAGQIGAAPAPEGQVFEYTINTAGRLTTAEDFENIVLRSGKEGRFLYLKDVARIELGAQSYQWSVGYNGKPSVAVGIYQLPGANALQIAGDVRAEMDSIAQDFPKGMEYVVGYDPTKFISVSIKEVVVTLVIAVILVVLTVYIFLQDLRTTLIPALTIPVSLIGTFAVMMAMGISINTLSLFGLILVIGIVVDDSICVVENTMRIIDEEKLSAKEATSKAMKQITGPVIATTLVLLAVFVPTAMMGGITGRLYRQFAITISVATCFSSLNALTLSPALCGMLLRPTPESHGWFFTRFNNLFDRTTNGYMRIVHRLVRKTAIVMVGFLILLGLLAFSFTRVPGGFIPNEDEGYVFVSAILPDGASLRRTEKVMTKIDAILKDTPGVKDYISINGYSLIDSMVTSNAGTIFVIFDDWDERTADELKISAILQNLQFKLAQVDEALCFAFSPPPIQGLGSAGGFEFQLQDRGGTGTILLQTVGEDMVFEGNANPSLTRMSSGLRATVPQLYLDIDRIKAKNMNVPLQTIFTTLQANLGSLYVNDFNLFGKTFKVMMQADSHFREKIEDITRLEVKSAAGKMIPLDTLIKVEEVAGPQAIFRYNLYPTTKISGAPAPGKSTGESIEAMEAMAEEIMPPSMGYEWTGVTYQQIKAGNMAPVIFTLAFIFVYLFLAAQYESWSIPYAIILSVPLALLGAILSTWARSFDNNIYTQIGFVLLIGLCAKTAILIVEFAKQLHDEGKPILEAATDAARLRFRPLLMTAVSFILGVFPLVIASGAGAVSRQSLGTAVCGGMLCSTVFGVLLIPVFYVVIQRFSEKFSGKEAKSLEMNES
ncbi:MAG: multidrug efflux RND transporter permease subunit [Planctomycetes bacterium]|nr:multidrug efflux RND transporter permease subunit [Planctomycetota bacterium]